LLDTNICGETQLIGDLQGQYYWEQNSYLEEQPNWLYQKFQQNVSAATRSYLEDCIKQMAEVNKQMIEDDLKFQQHMQSLQVIKVQTNQVEQVVSIVHQIQENKMSRDDVQPVSLLEVTQCDTCLDDSPGKPIKIVFVSSNEHKVSDKNSSECVKEDLFDSLMDDECIDEFNADFPSITGFDDNFTCQNCTNAEICSMCAEFNDDYVVTNDTDTYNTSTNNTNTVANVDILAGPSTIPQDSTIQSDLDELNIAVGVDKSSEIFSCECGVCNACCEINAAISGEEILMPTTICAEIQGNSATLQFDTNDVDFSHNQAFSIVEKLLVEPLIKPRKLLWSFVICASIPPILYDTQANCGFCDIHVFVSAGLQYLLAIPPKPPDCLLKVKFACYLLLPVTCIRSVERPPPKPPDRKAAS
jgi:hypothetical protein